MSDDTKLTFNAFVILVSLLVGIDIRYMHTKRNNSKVELNSFEFEFQDKPSLPNELRHCLGDKDFHCSRFIIFQILSQKISLQIAEKSSAFF